MTSVVTTSYENAHRYNSFGGREGWANVVVATWLATARTITGPGPELGCMVVSSVIVSYIGPCKIDDGRAFQPNYRVLFGGIVKNAASDADNPDLPAKTERHSKNVKPAVSALGARICALDMPV